MKGTFFTVGLFFIVIWLRPSISGAQAISLERLSFDNAVEREVFSTLHSSKISPVDLFVMMGPEANYATIQKATKLLDEIVAKVKEPLSKKKSFTKQMEYLQQVLHDEYLKKYQLVAKFSELVDSGTFNCVTGTALYALVLDRMGISSQIYEQIDHVYLTAGVDATIIESTNPAAGIFTPDERFRKALISSLVSSKLVTQDELEQKGANAVFSDAMLPDKKIDLQKLAGLQYRNDALQALQASKWKIAHQQYLKSHYLYPCKESELMVFLSGIMNLGIGDIEGLDRVKEAIYLLQNIPDFMNPERIHEMVEAEIEEFVNENYTPEDWTNLEPLLLPFKDDTLIYEQAQFRVLGERYDAAWNSDKEGTYALAHQLYSLKPWHGHVRNCLIDNYLYQFRSNNDYRAILDSLDGFTLRHPFASANDQFHSAYMIMLLGIAASEFEGDEQKKAEPYLARFEQMQASRPGLNISEIIGGAYSAAVRSYVRIPDYKNAKRCLMKGLELAPYSTDINGTKRSFGKELGVQ